MPSKNEESPTNPNDKTWGSTGITGLVLHIPSGNYYHRYSIKGRRVMRSFRTKRFPTAKLRLAEANQAVEIKRADAQESQTDRLRTLGDLERLFFTQLAASPSQREPTKRNYRVRAVRMANVWPEYKTTLVDRVTAETVVTLRATLQHAKFKAHKHHKLRKGYSPASVNQVLFLLKLWLELAKSKGVIHRSPFDKGSGMFKKVFLPTTKTKVVLPSRFDMDRILTLIEHPPAHQLPHCRPKQAVQARNAAEMARLLAFSGMRHREASAAQWEDVEDDRLKIRGTKSASAARIIPITPALGKLLEEMRARRIAENKPLRGKILWTNHINPNLRAACARLNLPRLSQHSLRHYFATTCIESGVDIPTVSKWLGHGDGGALAMQVYGHLRDEHGLLAAQKVNFAAG